MEDFSGADIQSCCQEAGMSTIKARRVKVKEEDFIYAIKKIRDKKTNNIIQDTISFT